MYAAACAAARGQGAYRAYLTDLLIVVAKNDITRPQEVKIGKTKTGAACNTYHIALLDRSRLEGGVIWRWGCTAP